MNVSEVHSELWHYSTADGLAGIIQSKQLWATRVDYLNDSEEFVGFFNEVLPSVFDRLNVEQMRHNGINPDELRVFFRDVLSQGYWTFICSLAAIDKDDPDKGWLTENGRLSQWRGYGSGGGYALVFDTSQLEGLMKREADLFADTQLSLLDAEYGMHSPDSICHGENRVRMNELIAELPDLVARMRVDPDEAAFRLFNELLFPLAVARKNRAFREEREVRLVVTFPNPAKQAELDSCSGHKKPEVYHHNRRGVPVPSIHLFEGLELTDLPIKRIVIGPHREKHGRFAAVRSLLDTNGFHETAITVSKIPFVE